MTETENGCCGYWDIPSGNGKKCGECVCCTDYGDYLYEQEMDRKMDEEVK